MFCHRVKTVRVAVLISGSWAGVGWGGDNTNRVYGYATWSSLALHATLLDFHLHFHDLRLHFMLRYLIFTCTFIDGVGWGGVGIIPTASMATLHDLHLHFMLRYLIFASAGEFQRTERFQTEPWVFTQAPLTAPGSKWKLICQSPSDSQSKQIPLRIRSWQWRFTLAEHDNLFQLCGTQVAKL